MEFSRCVFGFALIAVFLSVSEGRDLPTVGLLEEMPKNCTDKEFCLERHVNYPQEKINMLLTKKYQLTLGSVHEEPINRDGKEEETLSDCERDITYGEIYEIIDENDNVRVVVQSPELFKQQVRIEQCANPGRLLREGGTYHFFSNELKDNEISCIEKRLDYSFLVLTRDGEGVESVKSKNGIPVCCSCRITAK